MAKALSAGNSNGTSKAKEPDEWIGELYTRPGFLIRRANQIAVSLFLEESADLSITTTQYGALTILSCVEGLDQIGLANRLGIDRSTTALVLGKLESAGYVSLKTDIRDKRRNLLQLTPAGISVLEQMVGPAARARERLLSVFTDEEKEMFMHLLSHFVDTLDEHARAPLVGAPYL